MNASQAIQKAKYSGWNSDTCSLDIKTMLEAIKTTDFSLLLNPIFACNEIYSERKNQISQWLDIQMQFPSFKSAQNIHEIMTAWISLIKRIPNLSALVIEGEINLVKNLCIQSKQSFIPGERLIYTAYSTLNNKVPYDQTFKEQLDTVIVDSRVKEELLIVSMVEDIEDIYRQINREFELGSSAVEIKQRKLLQLSNQISDDIKVFRLFYGFSLNEQRLQHLKKLKEIQKAYSIKKIKKLQNRILEIEAELNRLEERFAIDAHALIDWKIKIDKEINTY